MTLQHGFVHLDVRSYFSMKEGAFSPEELAARAAQLGMPAVAMTDRNGLYGAARFVDACEKAGVRPLLGATLTLLPIDSGRRSRESRPSSPRDGPNSIIVIAQDANGYANLCRLITDAHMLGERGEPSLAPEQLCAHAGGLVCLLGPSSPVGVLARQGHSEAARREAAPFRDAFGDRLHVAIENRLERDSTEEVRALLRLADVMHLRAVATNPVRYLVREDAFLADALECMRELVPLNSTNVTRSNAEGYLKTAREMRVLFQERPELCDAALDVADSCRFDLGLHQVHFPEFPTPAGRSAGSVLAERAWRGVEERGMKRTPDVEDRLTGVMSTPRFLRESAGARLIFV